MPKGITSFYLKSNHNNRKSGDMPDRKAQLPLHDRFFISITITQKIFPCQTSSIAKHDIFRQEAISGTHSCACLCKFKSPPEDKPSAEKKKPCTVMDGTGCIFLSELGFQKRIKDLSVFLFLWLKYITDARKMCVYCLNRFLGNY